MKFLRVVRRGRWAKYPDPGWPEDSGLSCDAFEDMRAKECNLSVYAVTDKVGKQRVAVAFAAAREEIALVDYIVFKNSGLESLGVDVRRTKGETPDNDANDVHYNLGNLTAKRLAQLTEIVSAGEHGRMFQRDIRMLLHKAVKDGQLDVTKIKSPKMRASLSRGA